MFRNNGALHKQHLAVTVPMCHSMRRAARRSGARREKISNEVHAKRPCVTLQSAITRTWVFTPLFTHAATNRHPAPTGGLPSNKLPSPSLPRPPLTSQTRTFFFTSAEARVSLPPTDMALRNEATKAASQSRRRFFDGAPPEVEISLTCRRVAPRRRWWYMQKLWRRWDGRSRLCGILLWDGQCLNGVKHKSRKKDFICSIVDADCCI